MPHIDLPDMPGIRAAMAFRPETAKPLNDLADVLLHGPHPEGSLTSGERELIATYVSAGNDCRYCQTIHGAVAAAHFGDASIVAKTKLDATTAPISAKLKALLAIAGKVRDSGKKVTTADIEAARAEGASDVDIHDTVLIAAAFCMFNRYVDGLATVAPDDPAFYASRAATLVKTGYRGTNADLVPKPR